MSKLSKTKLSKIRLPKIPKIGVIPEFNASAKAVKLISVNAAIGVLLFGFYQDWRIAILTGFFIAYQGLIIHRHTQQLQFKNSHSEKSSFKLPKVNQLILATLLIASIAFILALFGGKVSSRPATALLCLLMGLKLLEARDVRGYAVTCMLMYFLAAVTFSYENSSTAMLFILLYCVSITTSLYCLFQPQSELTIGRLFAENSKIIAKAIPLTLIIFFLFPRIQGDFGFLPGDDRAGTPGFGDSISAGDLSSGAFSNALAFRVEFPNNEVPSREKLYWRSKVFSTEKDFSWRLSSKYDVPISSPSREYVVKPNETTVNYTVIHQASKDHTIPTLEQVVNSSRGKIFDNGMVYTKNSLQGATSYTASSLLTASDSSASLIDKAFYLRTSFSPKRKTKALLDKWQTNTSTSEELVQAALNHFRTEPFKYNLVAPELNPNQPIEDFLFDNQVGYCEHYASVFTTLMRWLDIPSRVVIGFQGGSWVPEGNFLEVRYSDAHAWSEVWLEGKGWTRVDPTFAIAPERIEFGMGALIALLETDQLGLNIGAQKLADLLKPKGASKAFKKFASIYQSFNHKWDKWVVNFSKERQLDLLENLKLGKENAAAKLLGIMFALCIIFASYILFRILPKRPPITELDKLYQRFVRKLSKNSLEPKASEGALSFGERAAIALPEKRQIIIDFVKLYTSSKYSKSSIDLSRLKHIIEDL